MAKNISVMGIYTDRATVAEAVKVLEKSGYRPADISVLASDNLSSKDFGHRRRARAMEGAGCGAALGAVIGAVAGWLISTQVLPVPSWLPAPAPELHSVGLWDC
jgi:hypothetical protein